MRRMYSCMVRTLWRKKFMHVKECHKTEKKEWDKYRCTEASELEKCQ
jgi:hypothetical protein